MTFISVPIEKMYKDMYWSQIFNRHTSLGVKWVAIRCLWIMRTWGNK